MPWVRFDDQYPIHRKVKGLSDSAFRLHTEAIFWCARNLTDGFVPAIDLPDVATARRPLKFLPELVVRGLWHLADEVCGSEKCPAHVDNQPASVDNGWLIHDYFEYQPTKAKVLEERANNAERQKRHRERHRDDKPESDSERNGVSNAVTNGRSNTTPSRPVPSRRDRDATGSQSSSRRTARAWADDDDSIDLGIVELLAELADRQISILDAARIRQRILGQRQIRTSRAAYVAAAIQDNPGKFLPAVEGVTPDFDAPSLRSVPDWCGYCESDAYRWLELADGTWAKCPSCNPDAAKEAS
jgi:hypothetical protein